MMVLKPSADLLYKTRSGCLFIHEGRAESISKHMQHTRNLWNVSRVCSQSFGDYPIHIISVDPRTSCSPDHIKDYMALQEHI